MRARTSDARLGAVVALLWACAITPPVAMAGDDVDYSAPYLVVEDGKLVTRYPAREHTGDQARPAVEPGAAPAELVGETSSQRWYVVAGAAVAVVVGLFLLSRRRTRTSH